MHSRNWRCANIPHLCFRFCLISSKKLIPSFEIWISQLIKTKKKIIGYDTAKFLKVAMLMGNERAYEIFSIQKNSMIRSNLSHLISMAFLQKIQRFILKMLTASYWKQSWLHCIERWVFQEDNFSKKSQQQYTRKIFRELLLFFSLRRLYNQTAKSEYSF